MCTYFEGVDYFAVGIQQLIDFMGWKSNTRDDGWIPDRGLDSSIFRVVSDDYVVVRLSCEFGRISRPCVCSVFRNFVDAMVHASSLTDVEDDCMASRSFEFDMYFCYEVWHVVDDADLWNPWESEASANRIDVIYKLDEKSRSYRYPYYDGIRFEFDYLYRVYVPFYGFVLFKREHSFDTGFFVIDNELIYEWLILDDYARPATCFDDLVARPERHQWFSEYSLALLDEPFSKISELHFERLSVLDALEMLRDAIPLRVGGDVGETC